jgi:hypothetical protein
VAQLPATQLIGITHSLVTAHLLLCNHYLVITLLLQVVDQVAHRTVEAVELVDFAHLLPSH